MAIAAVLGFLGAYVLAALWARELTVTGGASPWFPGAGVALALLIAGGPRFAPAVFIAELISAELIFAVPYSPVQDVVGAASFTACLTGGALALRHLIGNRPSFASLRELGLFTGIGVIATPLAAGLSGFSMLCWAGVGDWSEFAEGVRAFAVGDAIGIAALSPLLLMIATGRRPRIRPRSPGEPLDPVPALQGAAVVAAPLVPLLLPGDRPVLLALTLVPIAWVALTRSFPATTLAVVVAVSMTTIATTAELGPSVQLTDNQLLLLTVALLGLWIGVMMEMLRESQVSLAFRATHDPLTRLPNRDSFLEEIHSRLAGGSDIAVLFIDLDRFKLVNDTLGHETGDRLLISIAARLAGAAAGPGAVVARFGGDEFTAVSNGSEGDVRAGGERLAQRLLDALAEPVSLGDRQVAIDVSVGIAFGHPGSDPDSLVGRADLAMFSAKQQGGSKIALFDEGMSARADRRVEIERGLRRSVANGELSLSYQPMVPMRESSPTGVEALLRWTTASGEAISPGEFIPIAEETGLIAEIGRWALNEACRAAGAWPGELHDAPTVWVNVSPHELSEPGFVDNVIAVLAREHLEGHGRLGIELTEQVLLDDGEGVIETFELLRDAGVMIALDDFGTGYSSLSYLNRLPIDAIKIDRSFLAGARPSAESDPVMATIADLARRLGLLIVGEGVETALQRMVLERLGADMAQGWLLGREGTIEAAYDVLRRTGIPERVG